MEEILKECRKCHVIKSVEYFSKCKTTNDGFQRWCKVCMLVSKHERLHKFLSGEKSYIFITSKICIECKQEKDANEFGLNSQANDGKQPHCKSCENAQQLVRIARYISGEKPHLVRHHKYCPTCDTTKQISGFYVSNSLPDGHSWYCKICSAKRGAQWAKDNPQKCVESVRRRRIRKAGIIGVAHTLAQWEFIKEKQGYLCYYCGKRKKLTRDHIIPVMKGGSDSMENIIGACRGCNSKKGIKSAPIPVQPCLPLGII